MKISKLLVLSSTTALLAGGLFVLNSHAAGNDLSPRHRPGAGAWLERAKEKLGLTSEQVGQIKAVLKSEKDNLIPLLTRLQESRAGLRAAIRADESSETSVRVAAARLAATESDLAVERMKLFHQISPILTSEQRAKLKDFQARTDEWLEGAISRVAERLGE